MSIALTAKGMKIGAAAFEHAFKMLADAPKGNSLVGYAQAGVVEPSCLVDESVRTSDLLQDVLQMAQSVYGGYYLRAFSMHNISIGNSSVHARLDKFSTARSPGAATMGAISSIGRLAMEEYEDRLVVDGDVRELPDDLKELEEEVKKDTAYVEKLATGVESYNVAPKGQQSAGKNAPTSQYAAAMLPAVKAGALGASNDIGSIGFSKGIDINEPVNVGVGRLVNVTIKEDGKEVQVPVLIRVNAMYMATAPLLHILGSSSEELNWGPRFKKWRLGGIDFWRDVVFNQDQIDIHKKNIKADKTGIYLQLMQKRRQNSIAAAISGSLSANNSSNIFIISSESAKELEMKIYGKLADFNTRQKLFQQGYGMLLFVVDKQWGTVRMYTRDIPEYTEVSANDLKASNKKGGIDIGDVLQAYRAGNSPRM